MAGGVVDEPQQINEVCIRKMMQEVVRKNVVDRHAAFQEFGRSALLDLNGGIRGALQFRVFHNAGVVIDANNVRIN